MASARIKIDEKEVAISEEAVTFGRTGDNTFSFAGNSNISRNHALIEYRDGAFHLLDLGSSNGTTLNGQRVDGDAELNDGDYVTLGNSVIVQFFEEEVPEEEATEKSPAVAESEKKARRSTAMLGLTGGVLGIAVVAAAVAGYVALSGGSSSGCNATARIASPRNGDVISDQTEIRVNVSDSTCVSRVVVTLNGQEIASFSEAPYTATLDPDKFADLSDGRLYPLQVALEDVEGNRIPQDVAVNLQFETREIATPTPEEIVETTATPTPKQQQGGQTSLVETRTMTANIVKKFTGASARYNLSNPEFLQEVRKSVPEFTVDGYYARASQYRDVINQSFVREKTLDPSLGYVLAMSRSKFQVTQQGVDAGLWQMSADFVNANAYNVVCPVFSLTDPNQECASRVAAFYMKDLVDAFDGDIVYAVAAFGKTPGEANVFKTTLPPDRSDFWKVLSDAGMKDRVARFFAAAIVAENPQRFKLKNDRPISELYPLQN
ncbi:MAG TPA: FHA domain-containing protein [Pyrinomonadaceae bacterium]|nr:FHA domain-containing protein [Pyrinomonadaceae bacterium]